MTRSIRLSEGDKDINDILHHINNGMDLPSIFPSLRDGTWTDQRASSLLVGLLESVARGTLRPLGFVQCLREMAYAKTREREYEIGDLIWMTWLLRGLCSGELSEEKKEAAQNLVDCARELLQEGYLSKRALMEVSDGEFMEVAGLVSSYRDGWRKREIRLNTRNVYAQRKFNLLREESEGYSKIVTVLNQAGSARVSKTNLSGVVAEIKSLIGYFDLDPNRVSSLILDAFAVYPHNESFIALIEEFGVFKCVEFLGFRLSRDDGIHKGLYKSAALLILHGLVSLDDLLVHFTPTEEEYKDLWNKKMTRLEDSVKKIGMVSLAGKDDDGGDQMVKKQAGQTARTIAIDTKQYRDQLWLDICEINGGEGSNSKMQEVPDKRLELLAELFTCGAWDHATLFIKYLRTLGVSDVASYTSVGEALCRVIIKEIPDSNHTNEQVVLSDCAQDAIGLIGCHLHYNLKAFGKVLGVVSNFYKTGDAVRGRQMLVNTILPAYTLVPSNVALSHYLWNDVLSKLPYTDRYEIYAAFEEKKSDLVFVRASEKMAETEVRRILRRVTAPSSRREVKMTVRPISRLLGKICHSNPFTICRQLLRQVMGMPGMVVSISESLKYLTPLTFDAMTFTILRQLSSGKRKLKEDGVNLEEWFQWLALFTGIVSRNQSSIEVTALLQYIVNQLKGSESIDLLVLKEIISTMTRISPSVDVSNQQLDTLAGSDTLINYVIGQEEGGKETGGRKDTVKATKRLLDSLRKGSQNNQLLLPLLILLAQQRKLITLHPPSKHLKLATELVDKCQEVTMQYIEFLQKSLAELEYSSLLPSIEDLVSEYKIDAEIILQLYRPLLKHVSIDSVVGEEAIDEEGEISPEETNGGDPGQENAKKDESTGMKTGNLPSDWSHVQTSLKKLAPDEGFRGISWELYLIFWAFELSDLLVPKDRYQSTLKQVEISRRNIQDDIAAAKRDGVRGHWGDQNLPQVDMGALKAELAALDNVYNTLPDDLKSQENNAKVCAQMASKTADLWVKKADLESQAAAAKEFVQHCILTRLFLSPKDAIYCVEFLRLVHKLSPPGLRLLSVVDRLFKELGFMVRCCTARESINLGIFFSDLMGLVSRWRSKKVYEEECSKSEVFKSYKNGNLEPVSHGEFIRLSANWHKRLTLDVFKSCIVSNDYMQMKNVLLVLNRMVRIYPATKEDAEELLVTLKPMSESDAREDLKTLARMYCTGLEMSIRDRQMVATRQEYAGLPPPPKKKPDGGALQENQSTKSAKQEQEEKKDIKDSKRKRPESTHATRGRGDNNHIENPKARSKYRDDRNGNDHMQKHEAPKSTADNVKPDKGGSTKPSRPAKSRRERNEKPGAIPERAEQNRDFADKRARRKSSDGTNKTPRNPERATGDPSARRHEPKNEGRNTKSRDLKKRSRSDEDIYSRNDQSKRSRRDEGAKKERKKSPSRGDETRSKRSFRTTASPSSSRHGTSRRPDKEETAQRDHRRDRKKR